MLTQRSRRCSVLCRLCLAGGVTLMLPLASVSAQYLGPAPTAQDATLSRSASAPQPQLDALLAAKPGPARIAPGDMIEARIFNVKAYEMRGRVGTDGSAIFPLAGPMHVAGMSVEELETALRAKLNDDGMIRDAQVNVVLTETPTRLATVSGEVNKPGTYPIDGAHTLLQLISMAQGLKDTASHTVVLYRPGLADGVEVQLGPNPRESRYSMIPVFSGDTVIVSKVGVIYVVGAVKTSGTYPLKDTTPTTLMQAVTMAGGPGFEADTHDVHVVHGAGTTRQTDTIFNLNKVMQGKQKDPVLQADDILLLPTDKMKAAVKGGGAGLAVSLASALIYLH